MNTDTSPNQPFHQTVWAQHVSISRTDSYTVSVQPSLLERIAGHLRHLTDAKQLAIITDSTVASLYGDRLLRQLLESGHGFTARLFQVPAGEQSKSLTTAQSIYQEMLSASILRRSLILALGGGVVIDLAGFVAATYLRGVPYINIPTTVIGQADASIGGKTAVNLPRGKNLIGAFWHPHAVFIDPAFLTTLSQRHVRNGVAELLKIAIISSPSLFGHLESLATQPTLSPETLSYAIRESIRMKILLLSTDPLEHNLQRELNFGHTFGHPLEAMHHFTHILHGEAVATGMALATFISVQRGIIPRDTASRIIRAISLLIPDSLRISIPAHELWQQLQLIRIIRNNHLHFVLPTGIGAFIFVDDISQKDTDSACKSWNEHISKWQSHWP